MPKKSKNLCVDDLRHAEYYGMQPVFDELYRRSLDGDNFTDLMDIILSRDNILLAYRNIKANGGSYTAGTDNKNISDIGCLPPVGYSLYLGQAGTAMYQAGHGAYLRSEIQRQ